MGKSYHLKVEIYIEIRSSKISLASSRIFWILPTTSLSFKTNSVLFHPTQITHKLSDHYYLLCICNTFFCSLPCHFQILIFFPPRFRSGGSGKFIWICLMLKPYNIHKHDTLPERQLLCACAESPFHLLPIQCTFLVIFFGQYTLSQICEIVVVPSV